MANITNPNNGISLAINSDGEAPVALTLDESKAGFAVGAGEAHDGAAGIARVVRPIDVSQDYRTRVGIDSTDFSDAPGLSTTGVANRAIYNANASTFSLTSAAGWLTLNAALSTASGAYAAISTYNEWACGPSMQKYFDIAFRVGNSLPSTGLIIRIGNVRQPYSSSTPPTDGTFLECNTTGTWRLVSYFNSGESAAANCIASGTTPWVPVLNKSHMLLISKSMYKTECYIDGVLVASIARPATAPDIEINGSAPLCAYIANNTLVGAATTLSVGRWAVTSGDAFDGRDYFTRQAIAGRSAHSAAGAAGAILDNVANSAAPGLATLSNTTAGYATPGGGYRWAAVAGAETDYDLFAYLVPAASATQRAAAMLITGANITMFNMGAANSATVPTVVQWWLAVGSTGVSLATADSGSARAPRRRYLGTTVINASAIVGARADGEINVTFRQPEICEPGCYVQIIARVVVGAATASQEIRGYAQLSKTWAEV